MTFQTWLLVIFFVVVVLAAAIVSAASSVRRSASGASAAPRRRMNPGTMLLLGVAMLAGGIWWFTITAPSVARYNGDPVCRAEFSAPVSSYGECHVLPATIVAAYARSRRSTMYYIDFRTRDGFESTAMVTKNRSGDVWAGARRRNDRAALVQMFGTQAALIRTASGIAETDGLPAHTLTMAAGLAIFGAVAVIVALFQLVPGGSGNVPLRAIDR